MKKALSVVLALLMVGTFFACSGKTQESDDKDYSYEYDLSEYLTYGKFRGIEIPAAEIEVTERETTFAKGDDSNSGEVQQDIGSAVPVDSIPSAAKRGISKALAEALAHGARTGAECLLTLDTSTGQPAYERVDGTAYSVQFPETFIEFLRKADRGSVILIHNHPSSSSFSNADLRTLAGYDSIKGMFVVGHDGTKYYVGKRDAQVTVETMLKTYEKFARQYYDEYYRLVNANRITPEQASKEFSHRVLESLAAELDLEYRRWDTP